MCDLLNSYIHLITFNTYTLIVPYYSVCWLYPACAGCTQRVLAVPSVCWLYPACVG